MDAVDVAIVGAAGTVGRALCTQVIERQLLPQSSRLQLIGRGSSASGRAVHGLRADLLDAYAEVAPLIDVAADPSQIVADLVVIVAGSTPSGASVDRSGLARANATVFREYADALAQYGSGHEVVVIVSNPVELGVAIFAERLGRHRVIGMGGWLDTLRFRRELAQDLGLRRGRVSAFVAGQHGNEVVPLWSSVRIAGITRSERAAAVARLRGARRLTDFPAEIAQAQRELARTADADMGEAFALIEDWPPDLRMVARAWLTHTSGAKTANGTANATAELIATVHDGRDIVVAGQVLLDGEIDLGEGPVRGVLGVPVVLGPEGWSSVLLGDLPDDERTLLRAACVHIADSVRPWTAPDPNEHQ